MKTNKLFYADTHLVEFSATVVDCFEGKKGFEIELDDEPYSSSLVTNRLIDYLSGLSRKGRETHG